MKHTSFVIPLLLTVLLFSCKKDDGGTTPQGGIALSGVVQAFSSGFQWSAD
jgi:hypothetical protein